MQDLQIECEKCGATLTIVREWPDGWKYRATVEPCSDCMEEAAQHSAQRIGGTSATCQECGLSLDDPEHDPYAHTNR